MKTILCYGDSNTWGAVPVTNERYSLEERWTGVLARELGAGYCVIEEGLGGRTTIWDDPIEEFRNGKTYLMPCLLSHKPIDLVIILLGTNDLKQRFSLTAFDIAAGAGVLVDLAQRSGAGPGGRAPEVLLMAPPVIARLTDLAEMFDDAEAKSRKFAAFYARVAASRCHFLDTSQIIVSSDLDGIHWDAAQHDKLGRAVAARVCEIVARLQ